MKAGFSRGVCQRSLTNPPGEWFGEISVNPGEKVEGRDLGGLYAATTEGLSETQSFRIYLKLQQEKMSTLSMYSSYTMCIL